MQPIGNAPSTSSRIAFCSARFHPSLHGKGLGRELLQLADAEARRAGFGSIYLYTHERMTENQALYARIGYVEYDRRSEKGFARVYMRKPLQ